MTGSWRGVVLLFPQYGWQIYVAGLVLCGATGMGAVLGFLKLMETVGFLGCSVKVPPGSLRPRRDRVPSDPLRARSVRRGLAFAAFIVSGVTYAHRIDSLGASTYSDDLAINPDKGLDPATQAAVARIATLSPRHRARALSCLASLLVQAVCADHSDLSREEAIRELRLVERQRGGAEPSPELLGPQTVTSLIARGELCPRRLPWAAPLYLGSFAEAANRLRTWLAGHPWLGGNEQWWATAELRILLFADKKTEAAALLRTDPAPMLPFCLADRRAPESCPEIVAGCWADFLDARAGESGAQQRLLAVAHQLMDSPSSGPELAAKFQCGLLAADLVHGPERNELLRPLVRWDAVVPHEAAARVHPVPPPMSHGIAWLLWAEDNPEAPVGVQREFRGAHSDQICRDVTVAPAFTVLHERVLERLEAIRDASPSARLTRAELLTHRAVWLASLGRLDEALAIADRAQEEWQMLRYQPADAFSVRVGYRNSWGRYASGMRLVEKQDVDALDIPSDWYARDGQAALVAVYVLAKRLAMAKALINRAGLKGGETDAMVDFFERPCLNTLKRWCETYAPGDYVQGCGQLEDSGIPEPPLHRAHWWWGMRTGLRKPLPDDAASASEKLFFVLHAWSYYREQNCDDPFRLRDMVSTLAGPETYPELDHAARLHEAVWQKSDLVVPLLLLGSFWVEVCVRE